MQTPKIKYVLTPDQISKFCELMGLDQVAVEQLNSIYCLNTLYIRDILIKHDYHELTKGVEYLQTIKKRYNYKEIKMALAKAYKMSEAEINASIQGRQNSGAKFCTVCGKRISDRQAIRTDNLCSDCLSDQLKL